MTFEPTTLLDVYHVLHDTWGPQHWWPGETPLEVSVGAILTQNTAWANAEKAIQTLRQADALNLHVLHHVAVDQLEDWIRSAGTFRVKAKRLRAFTTLVVEEFDGSLNKLLDEPKDVLRNLLLNVHGIGPETADCIVLYAAHQPQFVVDAYTRRFMARHGWLRGFESYDKVADMFVMQLPADVGLYNEYHALIVRLGKEYCRTNPVCESCPLRHFLPDNRA